MKATARPRHVGQLVNHRRANNAITTGTIAQRNTVPQHWSKITSTTMMTMPERAMMLGQDRMDCWPSLLASSSLRLSTTRVGRTHLSTITWPSNSK